MEFTAQLIQFRKSHPVFARKKMVQGRPVRTRGLVDIGWFLPDGTEMTEEDWKMGYAKSLGIFLFGGGLNSVDQEGRPVVDDSFYILFNAHGGALDFKLPYRNTGRPGKRFGTRPIRPMETVSNMRPTGYIRRRTGASCC